MSDTTTHLGLPYLLAAQSQKHVTHNEALRLLDGMVQLSVLDRTRTAPPASPADGHRHLVAAGATGLWAGWDQNIAFRTDGGWLRLVQRPGWLVWVEAEAVLLVFAVGGWTSLGGGSGTPGEAGADGASVYAVWLAEGNIGTEADFLAALVGPAGAQGPAGSQGLAGPAGANGATGPAGARGATGAAGPQGPAGLQGPAGPPGADGADGTSVTILGALALATDLPGAGNRPGDGYIIAGDLHVWDGSQWNNVGPITGPQGDPGADGVDGIDGADGVDGTDGASAYQIWLAAGNTGTVGDFLAAIAGAEGPPGTAGPAGPQGPVGAAGADGADGIDGTDGADGADGTDGTDGTGFLWRGPWAAGTNHAAQDVVGNGGSSYICTVAHVATVSDEPGVGTNWAARWAVVAAKGATGDLTAQGMIGSGPAVLSRRPVNAQGASYTLALSDEGASLHMTGATATTVTVPAESAVAFPLGAEIEIVALGAGTVTIAAATGVTLNGVSAGSTAIAGQYQGAVLRKYGSDTWLLMGAVGAVT